MRFIRIKPAAVIFFLTAGFVFTGCETQASLTKRRARNVEKGLLQAVYIKGTKIEKMSLTGRMEFYKVPGVSIAVIDKRRVEWAKAYGYRDILNYRPLTTESLFQAGALSRPLTAAVVLDLAAKGGIDMDGDIASSLRSWKLPSPHAPGSQAVNRITLRDLLTHSAGLSGQVFPGYPAKDPLPDIRQVLDGERPAANLPVLEGIQPGKVRESESGYVILQQLLTDLEGRPFPRIMKETVLDPLGMRSSTFEVILPAELKDKATSGHLREGQGVEGDWFNYPESAAKGLWTTPGDYADFLVEILGEAMGRSSQLLSAEAARTMLTTQAGNQGFGFTVEGTGDEANFNVQGKTRGYSSFAIVFPGKGQGVVVMTNSDNGGLLTEEIIRAVSAAYGWGRFKPEEKPLFRLDPSVYQDYVGFYEVAPDYHLDVSFEDYYLVIQPTGQARTKFYVESQTVFFSIDPYVRIQFRRDDNGVVNGLVLWQQDFEQKAEKVR
jgi:CubicO group peptidase (beta-lactamase class C family)